MKFGIIKLGDKYVGITSGFEYTYYHTTMLEKIVNHVKLLK